MKKLFDFIEDKLAELIVALRGEVLRVKVENQPELQLKLPDNVRVTADLKSVVEKLDELAIKLTPKDYPEVDLSGLISLLNDIKKTLAGSLADAKLDDVTGALQDVLRTLERSSNADIVKAIVELQAEVTKLSKVEPQSEFQLSEAQFKELLEELKKVRNAPIYVTGGAGAFEGPATAAAPSHSEGTRVKPSFDLSGKLRTVSDAAAGGTSSNFGSAFPAAGTAAGFDDGTNMRAGRVFDGDSGAGTQYIIGVILRKSAAGGSAELGTSTDPMRVDPTGTTTQPVSAASLPLPSGAATEAKQDTNNTRVGDLIETAPATDTASSGLNGRLQRIAQRLTSLIGIAATETTLGTRLSESDFDTKAGALTETAPATDTASSGLNGRLQRIAQRITSLIGIAATETTLGTRLSESDFDAKTGALTETAPTTDIASSGLNGRLQRIAQRITSLIALLPTSLGQKTMANSLAVVVASDQSAVPVNDKAQTAGGATPYKLNSAASTNATSVKASAGQIYMITVSNTNASARYLKIYNKASAPTVGTDTPVHVFLIPGNTAGAGSNIPVPACGLEFTTGIAFALTTGAADSDTGAVAANEIIVNLGYK